MGPQLKTAQDAPNRHNQNLRRVSSLQGCLEKDFLEIFPHGTQESTHQVKENESNKKTTLQCFPFALTNRVRTPHSRNTVSKGTCRGDKNWTRVIWDKLPIGASCAFACATNVENA